VRAQGRRATRLRYAPTVLRIDSTALLSFTYIGHALTVRELMT
jgi:hypothetical protein